MGWEAHTYNIYVRYSLYTRYLYVVYILYVIPYRVESQGGSTCLLSHVAETVAARPMGGSLCGWNFFFLAVAPDADHPTRTLTLSLIGTLWGDLCLDAVACEGSRLIRPKGDAADGGCAFQNSRTSVCI